MAEINVGLNKTNDPSYLNSSQGTDRASLQQLASVPDLNLKIYQPDHKVDTSTGLALKGLGDIFEAGVKLTDEVIQKKASDTLRKGIDDIRDSFGVAQAADLSTGVASAVSKGGAEGVSLSPQDTTPVAVNRLGNKVEGLTEAYRQGGLSNSAYYAKLEAFVRETKAQFGPGYNEIIDQKVSSIVGTTPANALRSSLLNDVTELQKKVQGAADKRTTYEHAKADIIHQPHLWPNYEQLKAEGRAPPFAEVELQVGRYEASVAQMNYELKSLAVKDAKDTKTKDFAFDIGLRKASEVSRNTVLGVTNNMGIKTAQDLRKYVEDIRSGTRPEPDANQLQQLTSMGAVLEQRVHAQMEEFGNTPINDKGETFVSKLRDPAKWDQLKQTAAGDITGIINGIVKGEHSLVASKVAWVKANDAITDRKLSTNAPNLDIAAAVHRKIGDNIMGTLIVNDKLSFGSDLMISLQNVGWVDASKAVPVAQTLEKMSQDDPSGVASRTHIKNTATFVIEQDKLADKTLGDSAFKSLFGPGNDTLLSRAGNVSHSVQVGLFTDMVSNKMTSAVAKRSKEDQVMYTNWATDSFASLFETQSRGVNQTAQNYKINGNLTLKFNPESNNFEYEGNFRSPPGIVANANKKLQGLNSAINSMKDVFKMSGKQPLNELYRLLPISGLEPGTPAYQAIQDEYLKANKPTE